LHCSETGRLARFAVPLRRTSFPDVTLRVPGALPRYAARFPTFLYIAGAIAL